MAAILLDTQPARLQIQVVMDDHQAIDFQMKFTEQRFDGRTAEVHPAERSGEFDRFGTQSSGPSYCIALSGEADGPAGGGSL
jgi:hypothetical protein